MLAIQSNGDRIFGKRNSLSSHKYLKSFVTNHGTWPHYFILMSCHTWQKYDMNNKNKEDLCWEADQLPPLVPSKKTYFMGYTVRSTMGKKKNKKIKFKEVVVSQTGIKWWDIHKTSSFIRVLSLSLVDEMEPPRILFCLQWKGKGEKRNKKQETEKKKALSTQTDVFSISVMVTNQNPPSFMKHAAPRAFICASLFCL